MISLCIRSSLATFKENTGQKACRRSLARIIHLVFIFIRSVVLAGKSSWFVSYTDWFWLFPHSICAFRSSHSTFCGRLEWNCHKIAVLHMRELLRINAFWGRNSAFRWWTRLLGKISLEFWGEFWRDFDMMRKTSSATIYGQKRDREGINYFLSRSVRLPAGEPAVCSLVIVGICLSSGRWRSVSGRGFLKEKIRLRS